MTHRPPRHHSHARPVTLLSLLLLLLTLSACGSSDGAATPSDSTLATLGGSVADYPLAADASVRAPALFESSGNLASGTIVAGSTPRLTLALTPLAQVPAAELEPFGDLCDTATSSDPNARGTAFSELEALQGTMLVGTLVQSEGELDLEIPRLSLTVYLYLLSDRPTRINGTCSEAEIRLDVALNLRRGWNVVRAKIDLVEDAAAPIRMSLTRMGAAPTTPWLFSEEWTWPFAQERKGEGATALAYLHSLPLFR
jgi:hypothetical protein